MTAMRHESGSFGEPGVLTPTVPVDIGVRSQRQRILEAMAKSCAEKSFAASTIADIVGHASISRATFYKHFADKRECAMAAADHFAAEVEVAAKAAHATGESPADALQKALAAVLALFAANPAYATLLLIEAPSVDPGFVGRYRTLAIAAMAAAWDPGEKRTGTLPDPSIAFGRAQILMVSYITAGNIDLFPELLGELVYIALLPFLGQDDALAHLRLGR